MMKIIIELETIEKEKTTKFPFAIYAHHVHGNSVRGKAMCCADTQKRLVRLFCKPLFGLKTKCK